MVQKNNLLYADQMAVVWPEYQRQRHANPEKYALRSTGLRQLDVILAGGIELGQYVLIGGAQKSGKTTLLMKVAKTFGMQRVNSILFSAEMTNMQLGTMLFSTYSGVERTKMRALGLEIADWEKIEVAGKEIEKLTLAFDYGFSTINDIVYIIPEVEAKTGIPVQAIFGDYIHLMEDPTPGNNRMNEIARISRGLKRLSNSLRDKEGNFHDPMAVIFAAQLNREAVKAQIIESTSFLGSGQLERDMDIGMIISKMKDDITATRDHKFLRKVTVVDSRETDVGDCIVAYDGATATISDKINISTNKPTSEHWK